MNPQMMEMAMKAMASGAQKQMSPEQMQQMMSSMGGMDPGMMQQQMRMMQNMSPADMERMQQQMSSMDPNTIANQAQQATKMMSAQQKYVLDGSKILKADGNKLHAAGCYSDAAEKYARARDNLTGMTNSEAVQLRRACVLNLSSCFLNNKQYRQCVECCQEVLSEDSQNLKALYRRGQAYAALEDYRQAEQDLEAAARLSQSDQQQLQLIQDKLSAVQDKLSAHQGVEQSKTQASSPQQSIPPKQERPTTSDQQQHVDSESARPAAVKYTVEQEDGLIEEVIDDDMSRSSSSKVKPQAEWDIPASSPGPYSSAAGQNRSTAAATTSTSAAGASAGLGGISPQHMQEMADLMRQNPELVRQATDAMKAMPAEQLAEMSRMAGAPHLDQSSLMQMQRSLADMTPEQTEAIMRMSAGMGPNLGGLGDNATMAKMAEVMSDPKMMKVAAEMMRNMPPEQLKAAMAQAGPHLPPGANIDPQALAQMAEQVAQMPPEQLSAISQAARSQTAGVASASGSIPAQGGLAEGTGPGVVSGSGSDRFTASQGASVTSSSIGVPSASAAMPDFSAMATPEMMKLAMDMMQHMSPDDMAAMSQMAAGGGLPSGGMPNLNPRMMQSMMSAVQSMDEGALKQMFMGSGMCKSEEQAAAMASQMKNMSPGMMKFMSQTAAVVQSGAQAAQQARQWLASRQALVLAVAVLLVAILLRVLGVM